MILQAHRHILQPNPSAKPDPCLLVWIHVLLPLDFDIGLRALHLRDKGPDGPDGQAF